MNKKYIIILLIAAFLAMTVYAIHNNAFQIGFQDAQKHKNDK